MISDKSGDAVVFPRLLIHKESGAIPNNGLRMLPSSSASTQTAPRRLTRIPRVRTLREAEDAMDTPLSMSVGSLDCDSTQADPPPAGVVDEIEVPAATAIDSAFYDVAATFAFGARP